MIRTHSEQTDLVDKLRIGADGFALTIGPRTVASLTGSSSSSWATRTIPSWLAEAKDMSTETIIFNRRAFISSSPTGSAGIHVLRLLCTEDQDQRKRHLQAYVGRPVALSAGLSA